MRPEEDNKQSPDRPAVLVIEADEAIRAMMEWLLSERGYDVHSARSCAEALAFGDRRRADVVLSDALQNCPESPHSAIRVAAKLGAKTVLVVGSIDHAASRAALRHPGVWLLPRPFSREALFAMLQAVLDA